MTNINLKNTVIGNNYNKVIDTDFKTFGVNSQVNIAQITIEQFFKDYNDIFYQIPKEGDLESHKYILDKMVEYLGVKLIEDESIQALLDEIDGLKRQILETNKNLSELTKINKNNGTN